jgi:hypothetical protein
MPGASDTKHPVAEHHVAALHRPAAPRMVARTILAAVSLSPLRCDGDDRAKARGRAARQGQAFEAGRLARVERGAYLFSDRILQPPRGRAGASPLDCSPCGANRTTAKAHRVPAHRYYRVATRGKSARVRTYKACIQTRPMEWADRAILRSCRSRHGDALSARREMLACYRVNGARLSKASVPAGNAMTLSFPQATARNSAQLSIPRPIGISADLIRPLSVTARPQMTCGQRHGIRQTAKQIEEKYHVDEDHNVSCCSACAWLRFCCPCKAGARACHGILQRTSQRWLRIQSGLRASEHSVLRDSAHGPLKRVSAALDHGWVQEPQVPDPGP